MDKGAATAEGGTPAPRGEGFYSILQDEFLGHTCNMPLKLAAIVIFSFH